MKGLDCGTDGRRRVPITPYFIILIGFIFAQILLLSSTRAGWATVTAPPCGQQPVNICLMLDRTGSVSSSNLAGERTAAKAMIDKIAGLNGGLGNGTRVAVGRFGDATNGGLEAEIIHNIDTDYNDAKADIDTFLASNSSVGTNVKDAINVCQTHLTNNANGNQNIIILLSDFDPSEPTNPDTSAFNQAASAKNAGMRIFAIGFDVDGESAADETNRALGASIASGNAQDNFCTASNCDHSGTDEIALENADGDDWFLSPTSAELDGIFNSIFQTLQCEDDGNACTLNHCVDNFCVSDPIDNCIPCENPGQCDDNNPCTSDSCSDGRCQYEDNNGVSCDDGDGCTEDDVCEGGECQAGDPKDCDDDRSCSTDRCLSPSGQCDFNLENCKCNSDADCEDDNECTDDHCDLDTGECSNLPDDENTCDDKSACTSTDHCDAGQCVGSPITCNDNKPCTDDSCDPATGCKFTNDNENACTDNDGCTDGDHCAAGECIPGGPKVCNDHRSCSADQCVSPGGTCDFDLSECECNGAEDCDDHNPCTDDSCNEDAGTCVNTPNDTNSCSDGNACTSGDHCSTGDCVGSPVTCNDDNSCTDDSCNEETGCVFINNDENTCSDEEGCTAGDHCASGACVPGDPKVCDDHRSCSTDQCVSPSGDCDFDLSQCQCESAEDCDDNDPCTDDQCGEGGLCTNEANQSCLPPPPDCGNGTCGEDESCGTCPQDCGECPGSCGNGICDPGEDCKCADCAETDTCRIQAQQLKCAQDLVAESNGRLSAQSAEDLAQELVAEGVPCTLILEGQSTIGGCAFQVDSRNTQLSWIGLACVVFGWAPLALRRIKVRRRR